MPAPPRSLVPTAAALAAVLLPAAADAAPSISGADGDVWNAASAPPSYVVTGTADGATIRWQLRRAGSVLPVATDSGPSPLTLTFDGAPDGALTLVAAETGDPGRASRSFSLDTTPPTITLTRPADGATYERGERVTAAFACAGATSCAGTVADGAPIDTASTGARTFTVRAADAAGNAVSRRAGYRVAGTGPAPTGTPSPPSPPIRLAPPPDPGAAESSPETIHPERARPRAGAVVTGRRPVLRWTAVDGARLYNVQVYRVRGATVTKVVSRFPEGPALRVPAGRLAYGERYVWRVWPLTGGRYTPEPHAQSWFELRRPVRLTAAQLLVNQRISQAALRRIAALGAWLDAGVAAGDLRDGGLGRAEFTPGVHIDGSGAAIANGLATPRPVVVAKASGHPSARLRVSAAQLLVNQRISQAAVRRANALGRRLEGRLTGGDLRPGAVAANALAPGLTIASAGPVGPGPAASVTDVRAPGDRRPAAVALTDRQVLINQRISQAAVRRANALIALTQAGLTGAQFRDGSIGPVSIAPSLR